MKGKFAIGLVALIGVSLVLGVGVRLLGKTALFHYLEREHLQQVMTMTQAIDRVAEGGSRSGQVAAQDLLHALASARALAERVDSELFGVELWAFQHLGFDEVITLPRGAIERDDRLRALIEGAQVATIGPALAARMQPDLAWLRQASDRFGPLVADATRFVKVTVLVLNLLGLGVVLAAFLLIRRATLAPVHAALQAAQRIAGRDLAGPPLPHGVDEVGRLNAAIDDMKDKLAAVVGDVRGHSQAVAASLAEMASAHGDLSARSEQQAATLQQTAASIGELGQGVRSSGQLVRAADAQAVQARSVATRGGTAVGEVVARMDDILAASRRIADINGVIDGIAFQTNILALNAAVEAARAGGQGRGFAVVASEVRSLAQRSAGAAREIAGLITDTVEKIERGAAEAAVAGSTIDEVVQSVQRVSSLITDVAGGLAAQEGGIAEIDRAMGRLDDATQQNAAMAEQSVSATESVRQQSDALVQAVGQFRLGAAG